jgi:hypothetical protein
MVWRVLNSSRYRVYQPVQADNGKMRAAVLLRVDEDGTPTGNFRVALGGEAVRVEIWSNDLFDHKPLKGFHLVVHHDVDDIDLRSNSLTSKWDDLEDHVGRGLVRVMRPGSAEDQGQVFRKALDEWRKTNPDERSYQMDNTEERAAAAEAEPPSPAGLGQETPEGQEAIKPGWWSHPPLHRPPQHGGGGAWRLQGAECGPLRSGRGRSGLHPGEREAAPCDR